ncbi:trehalose-phosphatase [Salinilacihabitans rarus]|uniref:trehalose-phosphatase n=1 Tax=Salinilacihabitans rarus TaxID=2961596 RepID=UPI0020C842A6|nr:trehalose-phosphatase [Salinilacihabitans rarus]
MTETRPDPVDERLPRLRAALRDADELLVCLDFDGTLAPIVADPDDAATTPATGAALRTLDATPDVTTAVVTGRSLADVRWRVDPPDVYAGNHGLELAREAAGSVAVHPVARKRASRVEKVCAALGLALDPIPGCRVENKRLTGTVHLRSVPRAARPAARRLTRRVLDRLDDDSLSLSAGKAILEVRPDVPWGKGDAVDLLASSHPGDPLVAYVGDDVTDESAFRAVEPEGIGVHVGDGPSVASCRVDSPAAVASLLHWIASVFAADEPVGEGAVVPASLR